MSRPVVPSEIRSVLDELNVTWHVEDGAKHNKLIVNGRMVTVLPRGGGRKTGYVLRNVIASIRREARRKHQ